MRQGWKFLVVVNFVLLSSIYAKSVITQKEALPVKETPKTQSQETDPTSSEPAHETKNIETKEESTSKNWRVFQLGAGAMFDSDGGQAGAVSVTWNPSYSLISGLDVKAYLGGILSNIFAGNSFSIGDLALTLRTPLSSSMWVEAGGGLQYWTGTRLRNTYPQMKAALGYGHYQITYSSVFDSLLTTHQIMGSILIRL
jgi:hypothetical protein